MARKHHQPDVCRLQPLRSGLQPEDNRGHSPPPSGLDRLPVIVLVHSAEPDDDAETSRHSEATERNGHANGSEIRDNAPDARPRSRRTRANSLAYLELARRTKSIVITFNYRIGLLGYLPYVDSDDQEHRSAQTVRSNHALWDQIGLLHWLRHNVAHFGGEPANVSLMSADSKAIGTVQLLALSPMAKGLFKRLILAHDEPTETDPSVYFEKLLWMAQRARPLQRKLISELGLILERQHDSNGTIASSPSKNKPQDESVQVQANLEIDRRVLERLKTGSLEQLAELELGVSKVNVAAQFYSTMRLADVINLPNLDDKLLFPYFSSVIRANESLASGLDPGRDGFWPWLAAHLDDDQKLGQSVSSPLESVQLEAEYCGYMQRLYGQMLDRSHDESPRQNRLLANELKRVDPLKLIPRVSDQQLTMIMSASRGQSNGSHSDSTQAETQPSGSSTSDRRHQTGKQFVRWRRRNRTANAVEFYHLRHAHLLQQLVAVQKPDEHNGDDFAGELNQRPNQNADDDDEEELDEWLVTRLQRQQQQRSIMVAQHQQSSQEPAPDYSPLRARRHATSAQVGAADSQEHAGRLAHQLVELLGSFDLLIVFRAAPLVNASDNLVEPSAGLLGFIPTSQGKNLSRPLASYIQMADLHHVAALKSSPQALDRLCEFSVASSHRPPEGQIAKSFVLVGPERQQTWLLSESDETKNEFMFDGEQGESEATIDLIGQFARFGSLEDDKTNSSRRFDTLERNICWPDGGDASELTQVKHMISAEANVVPYLRRQLKSSTRAAHSSTHETDHEQLLLERRPQALADLVNCLSELDSISRSNDWRRPQPASSLSLTQEWHCLVNATNRLRLQLRADAAEELEPLIRQYFVITEQQRQRQQRQQAAGRNPEQVAREAAGEPQGDRRASTLTTRTLVNQSEGLYLDQLAAVSLSALPGRSQQLERELTYLVGGGGSQQSDVASNSSTGTGGGGGIRNYFAKTYKDAVGQALGIVIGTGSLIILLNLFIVLVIAWRSRQNQRRSGASSGHNTRQAVQDCSNTAANVAVPYNFGLDQSRLIGESMRDSMDCQQQALIDSVLELNASLSKQQQQANGCHSQTQNSTSFSIEARQLQMSRAPTCTSISSGSQRTAQNGKSIKFDLSGSGDQTTLNRRAPTTTNGHSQRGIMKQPATTSDEEEQFLQQQQQQETAMMVEGLCDTHYHQYHSNERPEPMSADACAQELAISPVSLDVLDLIPLGNLTSGYDGHELAMVSNSSDDYQQMVVGCNFETASSSNSMPAPTKCPHHEANQAPWQHKHQLRGGGSLTSPYGSQSTQSTTSASNPNGNGNNIHMSLHVPDLSPRRTQLAGQHSFRQAPAKLAMSSPPSSATTSSAHTPNLICNQQQYITLHGSTAMGETRMTMGTHQRGQSNQVIVYGTDSLERSGRASCRTPMNSSSVEYGRLVLIPGRICEDKNTERI